MGTKQLHPIAVNGHRGAGKLSVIKCPSQNDMLSQDGNNAASSKEHRAGRVDCVKSGFGRGEEVSVKCDTRCAGHIPTTDCSVHMQGLVGSGV